MRVSTCVETHMYTRDLRTGNYRARLSCLQGALGTCLISLSAVVIVESVKILYKQREPVVSV